MSTHECPVVPVVLQPHPNADNLSLVDVYGWTVVVRTEDWVGKDRGVYIPPDYIVPDAPQFAFLGKHRRITVKRFRGVLSQGLLMPCHPDIPIGINMIRQWGIEKYEPPLPKATTNCHPVRGPALWCPKYDIESYERYSQLLNPGMEIVVTEKIHGANARFVWWEGQYWVGSRNLWVEETPGNMYWEVLRKNSWLRDMLQEYPNHIHYGEVYGPVQDLSYGLDTVDCMLFDVRYEDSFVTEGSSYLDYQEEGSWVPELYRGPLLSKKELRQLAEQDSIVAGRNGVRQMSEGIVIRVVPECRHTDLGRMVLKMVSNRYLERK